MGFPNICLVFARQGFLDGALKHLPEGGGISPYCLELSQVLNPISEFKRNSGGSVTRDSTKFSLRDLQALVRKAKNHIKFQTSFTTH